MSRLLGLASLVKDAVVHGSAAVERVHVATAGRTFAILETIPVVEAPARVVHVAHDAIVGGVYGAIRLATRAVGVAADAAIAASSLRADDRRDQPISAHEPTGQLPGLELGPDTGASSAG